MAVITPPKRHLKGKKIRAELIKELNFLKNVFSIMSIPQQMKGDDADNMDIEIYKEEKNTEAPSLPQRAKSIAELEEKLQKLKSENKFNLKNKLVKKSLSSKLNKKLKKKERTNKKPKTILADKPLIEKPQIEEKPKLEVKNVKAQPVFNTEGKLVFSKFDFAKVGQREKGNKVEKDPKKILENLKQQEERMKQLEENEEGGKVKQIKEKMAWKNVLQKAEGQKVKDDPILLKKTIKKTEQKKKHSKKQWENRLSNVQQKKDDRQKKRKDNISKKKKEKKSKVVKAAVKRGRVVI